jgi:protein SCO1/2
MELGRLIPVAAATLVLAVALVIGLVEFSNPHGSGAEAFVHSGAQGSELPELWPVPDFRYVDQHGATVTPETFKGKVWVANFIFTQCKSVCPLLTAKMVQLQRVLKGTPVHFVSFSVDPAHDTPEVLAAYATKWNTDTSRWTLLSTDEATLPKTAAGFKVTAMKAAPGGVDPIIHSAVFLLIDAKGMVRGAYSSEDRDDWKALEEGAQHLAGTQAKAPELPLTGDSLYMQLSCDGCHEHPELAPLLGGKAGSRVELATGLTTVFDEAYVKESIQTPQAKMVRGYTLQMPAYDTLLDDARLDTLTKWVLARPKPLGAQDEAAAHLEVDPVCHMKVRVEPDTLHVTTDGVTHVFCSELCRDRYVKNPAAYAVDAGVALAP